MVGSSVVKKVLVGAFVHLLARSALEIVSVHVHLQLNTTDTYIYPGSTRELHNDMRMWSSETRV